MTVTADMAISLDGCIAGTNVAIDNPAGNGAEPLFEWIHNLASWRQRQGMTGGEENRDSALMREWFDATGAVVMGRMMYDTGEEFWGDNPPFRAPVFVLTHRPRPTLVKEGGTTFTFVVCPRTDRAPGPESIWNWNATRCLSVLEEAERRATSISHNRTYVRRDGW